MARPRKSERDAADSRLIAALWTLLEQHHLSDITVGMVTDQAGLNRGTFYYHFKSMDALVERAIESELLGRNSIMRNVFCMMAGTPATGEEKDLIEQRTHKIALLIKQGGLDVLSAKVKSLATNTWKAVLCDEAGHLTPETLLIIEYTTSGIIGIVAHNTLHGSANVPPKFYVSFVKRNSQFVLGLISEAQGIPRETILARLQAVIRIN